MATLLKGQGSVDEETGVARDLCVAFLDAPNGYANFSTCPAPSDDDFVSGDEN